MKKVNDDSEGVIEASRQQVAGEAQVFNAAVAAEMSESMGAIQELVEKFNKHAEETMTHIRDEKNDNPKVLRVDAVRKDGKLSAVPVYEGE